MAFACDILADSTGPYSPRLTSFQITFPRVILAEVNTHRSLSKSSASSRAIPFARLLKNVLDDPYIPERWSKAGPGMSEAGWLGGDDALTANLRWLEARDLAIIKAVGMLCPADRAGLYEKIHAVAGWRDIIAATEPPTFSVHKQDINRLLEPWCWVTQVITGTEVGWSNFFALRTHKDAHPAFRKLARGMYRLYRDGHPEFLEFGQWHAPFLSPAERGEQWSPPGTSCSYVPYFLKLSAARCAWVSYSNHNKEATPDAVLGTWERLVGSVPRHASPLEHQGTPFFEPPTCNLKNWWQLRKTLADETVTNFYPTPEEMASWDE